MKYCILGSSRSGKDTLGEIFVEELGLKFMASSEFLSEKVIYPVLSEEYGYSTPMECFNDRHRSNDMRKLWYDLLTAYNSSNKSRLASELLREYDMYIGLRNIDELNACKDKNLFDIIIWIDAPLRVPLEPSTSITVTKEDADIIIENNGTEEEFITKVKRLIYLISNRRYI